MLKTLAVAVAACLFMPARAGPPRYSGGALTNFLRKPLPETVGELSPLRWKPSPPLPRGRKPLADAIAGVVDGDVLVRGGYVWLQFDTRMAGVCIDRRLRRRFPDAMDIIIEHQYRNLRLDRNVVLVSLSFDGVWRSLAIPLAAVTAYDVGVRPHPAKPAEAVSQISAAEALATFLDELTEFEPGGELAFSEILSLYIRQSTMRGWPSVSSVAMSRALKASGAIRAQKRLSATDKPIFYVLPLPQKRSAIVLSLRDTSRDEPASEPLRRVA